MRYPAVSLFIITLPVFGQSPAFAQNCPQKTVASLIALQGKVLIAANGNTNPHEAKLNDRICQGDTVTISSNSRASLELPGNQILSLKEQTQITLAELNINTASIIKIAKGFLNFISRKPKEIKIESGITNAMPLGTEFAFNVDDHNASVWVYEGKVKVYNPHGSVVIVPGNQFAQVQKGKAPQVQLDIHPQDAVNWALYYPPLLAYPANMNAVYTDIQLAVDAYRHGKVAEALSHLDNLSATKQTAYFHKIRGAMRLSIGQDELALVDINALLTNNPADAEALALQAVRALSQNRKDEAFALANKAITANPQSAVAYSALSFAEQGRFKLENALAAAQQASKLAAHDAFVWAHKAELELALSLTAASEKSAQRALSLDANLERTQTVMGFSHLTQMATDEALHSFQRAIQLDSSAPLPRLGLGLAKIKDGDLAEGRKDIEIAALLDPNNSLIRSYLGKAYYEENRNNLAGEQLNLAKARDPKDPTPYFYDALKKQTENRPVEALRDLQTAMELNDNRAVYRSKQLLDSDRAARGASIARIFNTIGLEKRATIEASKSLSLDPADSSSHRFLSDAYLRSPRQKIAQVSELLQAQLLQSINTNPIQPHLSVTGLGSISGIGFSDAGFKDFTYVFDHDRPQLTTSGFVGNHNTYSDEVVVSGIYKKLSYSFGQFHYETDGFRPNSGIDQNVYDVFLQMALTTKLNIQFEFKKQEIDQGNQSLSFIQLPTQTQSLNRQIVRGGGHWTINSKNDVIFSVTYDKRLENYITNDNDSTHIIADSRNGFTGELQFINRFSFGNVLVGGGSYNFKGIYNQIKNNKYDPILCDIDPSACEPSVIDNVYPIFSGYNFYTYYNFKILGNLTTTIGIGYENYRRTIPSIEINKINPKLGFTWDVTQNFRFRAAYFKTVKRLLAADQTIEPTQVAGFNQFYDDFNGTSGGFFGIALDGRVTSNLYGGFEYNHRELKQLNAQTGDNIEINNTREDKYSSYLYWSPISELAFNLELQHEKQTGLKLNTITTLLPISIKYFNPVGFFSSVKSTFIWQNNISEKNAEYFLIIDGVVGYRLPKRLGIISFEARNIFNRHFKYEDLSAISSDPFSIYSPFVPERTFFGKLTINF